MAGKTYLCGKVGKSVLFDSSKWSAIGGDNEAPTLITNMAKHNPEDTFVVIGRNDIDKCKTKLPPNVYSAWSGHTVENGKQTGFLWNLLQDVQIDGIFLVSGPTGSTNMLEKALKRNPEPDGTIAFAKTLEMHLNYSGPIYDFLNQSNIPWVMINNDPRYLKMGRDCLNMPQEILSQYNGTQKNSKIKSWDDQVELDEVHIPYTYAGMEKIFLIGKELPKAEDMQKTTKFMIVLNEGNNGVKSRYPMLKEYVLDSVEDVAIYGKWDPATIGDDKRFKGPKKFDDLQKELPHVKYTFIIPIKPGWVTAKWVEMISNGILPFFHPTYDEQKHTGIPDFLRVKNAQDLHEKIEKLEANPEAYDKLLQHCLDLITEDDLNGKKINDTILAAMNKYTYPSKPKHYLDVIPKAEEAWEDDEW